MVNPAVTVLALLAILVVAGYAIYVMVFGYKKK